MQNVTFDRIALTARHAFPTWWGAGEAVCITVVRRSVEQATLGALDGLRLSRITAVSEGGVVVVAEAGHVQRVELQSVQTTMRRLSAYGGAARDLRPSHLGLQPNVTVAGLFVRNISTLLAQVCPRCYCVLMFWRELRVQRSAWSCRCHAARHVICMCFATFTCYSKDAGLCVQDVTIELQGGEQERADWGAPIDVGGVPRAIFSHVTVLDDR